MVPKLCAKVPYGATANPQRGCGIYQSFAGVSDPRPLVNLGERLARGCSASTLDYATFTPMMSFLQSCVVGRCCEKKQKYCVKNQCGPGNEGGVGYAV